MGTLKGQVKVGWDEGEQKEFAKAIRQNLLVQTPLQVILETLFTRLQAQANLFLDLKEKVERLELRDITADEVTKRLRLVEEEVKDMATSRLSPFNQQDVLRRLEDVELALERGGHAGGAGGSDDLAARAVSRPASSRAAIGVDARLQELERRMNGVYNLGGKLIALEQMAGEMGVEIPDLEYSPGSQEQWSHTAEGYTPNQNRRTPELQMEGVSTSDGPRAVPQRNVSPRFGRGNASPRTQGLISGGPRAQSPLRQQAGIWPSMDSISGGGAAGEGEGGEGGKGDGLDGGPSGMMSQRSMRKGQSQNYRGMDLQHKLDEAHEENEALRKMVNELKTELASLTTTVNEKDVSSSQRISTIEKNMTDMGDEVRADIAILKKEVARPPEVSFADFTQLKSSVEAAVKDVTEASDQIKNLQETELKNVNDTLSDLKDQVKKAFEPRDMDTLFHQRISSLETDLGDFKSEFNLLLGQAMEDTAKISDLQAMEELLDSKAGAEDVKQLAAQQAQLAQSLGGMADWLALRPETTDGLKNTGAGATKFRCLTCDREIKTQALGPTTNTAKGTFLPKLDPLPAQHPVHPMGPGLNPGELKRMADERIGGTRAGASPPRGATSGDFDDYGGGESGRVKSGRSPVSMPQSAFIKAPPPGQQRTPVFL